MERSDDQRREGRQLPASSVASAASAASAALAGAVAHDLNNLLMLMQGHAEEVLGESGLGPEARASVAEIQRVASRAALLARQLTNISRLGMGDRKLIDAGNLLRAVATMLRPLLGSEIELDVRTGSQPIRVLADSADLEMIVLNLVLNARDAMPGGGRIGLSLVPSRRPNRGGSRKAFLSVRDSGIGMDRTELERAFVPFFTTKGPGRGTGLGLTSVTAIVGRNHWELAADSAPGRGSRFRIAMPMVGPVDASSGDPSGGMGRGRRVVVIEPNRARRLVMGRALRSHGFSVSELPDAQALGDDTGGPLDLAVFSLDAPQAKDRADAYQLASRWPGLRFLFITSAPNLHVRVDDPPTGFLSRQFEDHELATALRAVLADGGAERAAPTSLAGTDLPTKPTGPAD